MLQTSTGLVSSISLSISKFMTCMLKFEIDSMKQSITGTLFFIWLARAKKLLIKKFD